VTDAYAPSYVHRSVADVLPNSVKITEIKTPLLLPNDLILIFAVFMVNLS